MRDARFVPRLFAPLLVLALFAASGPAEAIYLVTPLRLHGSATNAEVGDVVDYALEAQNETEQAAWAGKTVSVWYAHDDGSGEEYARVKVADLTLDDAARATFAFTVTAELDDKNVFFIVEQVEGETLATADLAVGDAPPIMRTMNGPAAESGPAAPIDGGEQAPLEESEKADDAETSAVPGLAVAGVVGTLAVLAVALRRK